MLPIILKRELKLRGWGLIFQAIIYVFQDFVLKRDQSVLRFPPVSISIVRGFD